MRSRATARRRCRATRSSITCCGATTSATRWSRGWGTGSSRRTARSTAARSRPSSSTTATRSPGSRSCCTRSSRPSTCSGASSWRRCRTPPAVCVTEVPLLYETGGDERFDKVVVITAPDEAPARALGGGDRRPRVAACSTTGEGRARRLLVQEHRLARGARRVRRLGDGRSRSGVKRLLWVAVLAAVVGGGASRTSLTTSPPWYERIRYPLQLLGVHPRARARAQARPGAAGGGHLPGVEVPARASSRRRARSA